jgi:hypothetical protein
VTVARFAATTASKRVSVLHAVLILHFPGNAQAVSVQLRVSNRFRPFGGPGLRHSAASAAR